ncbi:hypothetical protein, partial [Pseudomonas ogarae]|uniref:hypothetical protein n=1 Tax=Pseudomonas ogarae (strain DSM 112162 / CECT 30235 / F113) TaxID=1114970 RepID=UPI00194F7008
AGFFLVGIHAPLTHVMPEHKISDTPNVGTNVQAHQIPCGSELARDSACPSNINSPDSHRLPVDYYQINQQCLSKPSLFTPTLTF